MIRTLLPAFAVAIAFEVAAQFPLTRTLEVRPGQQRPSIDQLVQDTNGLIWVGSDAEILRTDGERVDVMLRTENASVQALGASGRGVVAALSSGVLLRCDALGCDTLWTDTLFRSAPARVLVTDGIGRIWIGTYGEGVLVLEKGKARTINGLPDPHVNDLRLMEDGRVVVATDQGLAVCTAEDVVEVFSEAQGAPDNLMLAVTVGKDGQVWAGTDRSGAFRWKPGTGREGLLVLDPQWNEGPVRRIEVLDDLVWLGTQDHGVIMVDRRPSRGSYASLRSGADRVHVVEDMFIDRDGVLWWCDGSERIQRADPAILFVPEHEGLDLRGITALCNDAQDRIWFATSNGLFNHVAAFADELKVTRAPVDADPRTPIVSLAAASDGTIWAATFGSGVYALGSDGRVRHYTTANGLGNDNVLAARAKGDTIWFATLEGITRYAGGSFSALARDAGFVFDVLPHGRDALIATDGNGVMRWGAQGLTTRAEGPRTYYSIVQDGLGNAWAAGPGSGFCQVMAGAAPECIGADRPPFDGDLFSLGSCDGRLLAFGSTGVASFDPRDSTWTDATANFGLEGVQAQLNVLCNDRSGALWLACDKGLVRIRPTAGHFDPRVRTVIIGAVVDNVPASIDAPINTPHDRNDITVQFTGLHYADPAAVRFEYRLHGLDERVIRTRDREASFSALPPGTYRFEVRAFTGEAPVGNEWTTLGIVVAPPWWQRPWVVALCAILLFVAVFALLRGRERRLQHRERMEQDRVRFQLEALRSQVDPHFLFNSFNALAELIESDPSIAVEHLDQLSTFFRNILQVRDKDLITLGEELELLENYFALEQRRFGGAIALSIRVDEEQRTQFIVPLTLQLLVENALKHNVVERSRSFEVSVRAEGDVVFVENPVRPRLSPARSTGFGLDSIIKRYAALTERKVLVDRGMERFSVGIPLIRTHEHSDR